jgi:peroxiredoxin (alkyl hydroperoxide reductase subunit C)
MNRLANIGEKFPEFSLTACVSIEKGKEFGQVSSQDLRGQWAVVFFWPMDFTFVCPTEIAEFNKAVGESSDRGAAVYGVSTDTHFVHLAWRQNHPDLKDLRFPMLADNRKELSEALGVLHRTDKVPLRGTFIVDPDGVIRWVCVNDLKVGRSVPEVIRTLDALQTDELCPCNWEKGRETLKV